MCLLFQTFLFILKFQGDRKILNVSEFTAKNRYFVEDKPFFQYTMFWTNTSRIIKICTFLFVHNFVVSLKGKSLSWRSRYLLWKIHLSFTLLVYFSFCNSLPENSETIVSVTLWVQLLFRFWWQNTACLCTEFHAVFKIFHKGLLK